MPILDYTINILNLNLNLWNVLSLKWPIYEMSVYEMSFYEKSFYDMFFYEMSFYVSMPFYVIICNIHTVDWSGVNLISYSTPFLYCPAPNWVGRTSLHCFDLCAVLYSEFNCIMSKNGVYRMNPMTRGLPFRFKMKSNAQFNINTRKICHFNIFLFDAFLLKIETQAVTLKRYFISIPNSHCRLE